MTQVISIENQIKEVKESATYKQIMQIVAANVLRLGGRFNAAKPLLYAVCFNFLCGGN